MAPRESAIASHAVVPAKAGTHVDFQCKSKMDSGFRRNDEVKRSHAECDRMN
jgi:hypothetical protein